MSNLGLITLNVNGLGGATKRRAIFKYLRRRKVDVMLLQETHSTRDVEKLWSSEWGGRILFAHGTSGSRGVAILFSRNTSVEVLSHIGDTEGRFLMAQIKLRDTSYTLLNGYAPTADKPDEQISFLDDLEERLQEVTSPSLILGGDFNICIDPERDRTGRPGMAPPSHAPSNNRVRQRFTSFLKDLQLVDAWRLSNSTDSQFTFRRRAYASRLDLWLISDFLSELIHKTDISTVALSDHSAVFLSISSIPECRGPGSWRFDNELLGSEEFLSDMADMLSEYPAPQLSSAQSNWDFLKYEIRKFVICFQRKKISTIKAKRKGLEKSLKELEGSDLMNNPDGEEEFSSCKRELAELELAEAAKTITRTRANWAQLGERPTKYFLSLQKRKTRSQTMTQMFDKNEQLTSDPKKILEITSSFFEELYCNGSEVLPLDEMDWNRLQIPKIEEESRERLEEPYSEAELLGALKKMNLGKCPGSDGLTVEFFLKFWDLIKGPLMESLHSGLAKGELSTEQKRGIISLIPKKDSDRRKVGNWRPITLLNVDYKILTKAMSLRLQPVLGEIIHPDQTGFLPGRYIGENLRTIQDVIDFTGSSSDSPLLMAFDFQKAFDSVRWEFVYRSLREFGFGSNFVDGIKTIFKNIQSCTTNAGFTSRYFSPTQGVRQGCCVAPYLFIIAVEILGIQIRQEERVKGISVGPCTVKLSQFADDLTAFVADSQSAGVLLDLIDSFGHFSGLRLNRNKTHVLVLGRAREPPSDLQGLRVSDKAKILGLWFSADRSPMDHFLWNYKDNLDKARGICDSWFNRDLSMKGKITVVNSLILSLFQFVASNSELPKQVLFEIKRIVVHFIWNKRSPKIAYDTLVQNTGVGGLGLADLELRTTVARLGWIRRLMAKPDSFSSHFLSFLAGATHLQCLLYGKMGSLPGRLSDSPFYTEVFLKWISLHGSPPSSEEEVRGEVLWYNKRIKMDGLPFCWKGWLTRGVWRVEDLLDPAEGRFLSHTELGAKFDMQTSFLNVLQLKQSLPRAWRGLLSQQGECMERSTLRASLNESQTVDILRDSPKRMYSELLLGRKKIPKAQAKWEAEFRDSALLEDWRALYISPYRAMRETKLQSLQFRLLYRIIPCRKYLKTIRVVESSKCPFCPEEDTIRHFFLDCGATKKLWNRVADWLRRNDGPDIVSLLPEEILLGTVLPIKAAPMLNYLTLYTKAFIHRQKLFHGGVLGLISWLGELKKKLLIERYICSREGKPRKFDRWKRILEALG